MGAGDEAIRRAGMVPGPVRATSKERSLARRTGCCTEAFTVMRSTGTPSGSRTAMVTRRWCRWRRVHTGLHLPARDIALAGGGKVAG